MPLRKPSSCLTIKGGRDSTWVSHTLLCTPQTLTQHSKCVYLITLYVCCVHYILFACAYTSYICQLLRLLLYSFPKLIVYVMCLCVLLIGCFVFSTELYENLGQVGASIKHHLVEGMRNMWQQLNEFARSHSSNYSIEKEQQETAGRYCEYSPLPTHTLECYYALRLSVMVTLTHTHTHTHHTHSPRT